MTMLDDRDQLLMASLRDGAALRAEIERLRAALADVVKWADELGYYADQGTVLAPVFVRAKAALDGNEQFTPDYTLPTPEELAQATGAEEFFARSKPASRS
jgi:hypothetical protein